MTAQRLEDAQYFDSGCLRNGRKRVSLIREALSKRTSTECFGFLQTPEREAASEALCADEIARNTRDSAGDIHARLQRGKQHLRLFTELFLECFAIKRGSRIYGSRLSGLQRGGLLGGPFDPNPAPAR